MKLHLSVKIIKISWVLMSFFFPYVNYIALTEMF